MLAMHIYNVLYVMKTGARQTRSINLKSNEAEAKQKRRWQNTKNEKKKTFNEVEVGVMCGSSE